MKKIFSICSALVFAFTISMVQQVNAQDYLITFAGIGASTTVSTVEVENLPTGATITLNGGDILHLTSVVGISQLENQNSSMRIYPNPMMDNSILALYPPAEGDAVITVYEMTGKTVAKIHTYLENSRQEFRLSGLKNGMYLINATGNTFQYSGKILSSGQAGGNPGIEKVSSTDEARIEKNTKKAFEIAQSTVDMYYNEGERLKFKAISGIYSTIKTDICKENKTLSFNFVPCTDGDNNNYPVVEIGGQIWMAENLKTAKYNNGISIPLVSDSAEWISLETPKGYCWYNNDSATYNAAFGKLYNGSVISEELCPTGWHVPTYEEWAVLATYLGGEEIAGGRLKEAGLAHWHDPNTGATNETGFTALPGGLRDFFGNFIYVGYYGVWWSSQEWYQHSRQGVIYSGSEIFTHSGNENYGFSVRCLSDSVKAIPSLSTLDASDITLTSTISGGEITDDLGYPVTARGMCWSSVHVPTVSDSLTLDGTGTGVFTSLLAGLEPNLTYFIRAYATSSQGTSYGNLVTFKTFPLWPTLSTLPITNITSTSVTICGNIISKGASTVSAQGVCWSTHENPTIADGIVTNSSEVDSFTCLITGLAINTRYYVRAYATNSFGTGYGNEIILYTKAETGSVSDIDGNTYSTIVIGTQTWMAENLKTTKFNDGAVIPLVTDQTKWTYLNTPGYCWYNNDKDAYKATYGALYNGYTVNTGKLCPEGWHVPTDAEWTELTDYLGGYVAGGKLKEAGLAHWADPNTNATNETGFTALPGGARGNTFWGIGGRGLWWSSTIGYYGLWEREIVQDNRNVMRDDFSNGSGLSVRCIGVPLTTKDVTEITTTTAISGGVITPDWGDPYPIIARGVCWSSIHTPTISDSLTSDGTGGGAFTSSVTDLKPNLTYFIRAYYTNSEETLYGNLITFKTFPLWPTVSTAAISNVTKTSAISGGNVLNIGASAVTVRGVCWSTNDNPTIADSKTTDGIDGESFTSTITGIVNTKYNVRAYATNSFGTGYGNEIMFATKGNTGSVSDIDGNTYSTIEIGTQTWMTENLKTTKFNDGIAIPLITENTKWFGLSTPAYCWYNNDKAAYKSTYGALYNSPTVNTGKLCPAGWHVPSDAEWNVLTKYLGGKAVADGKLKEAGFAHWSEPNIGATNETGFTALPGGMRWMGMFQELGYYGYWWRSTNGENGVSYREMGFDGPHNYTTGPAGYSVRCLKD